MVGYHKHDKITQNQKLFAGVFSGVITRFITQPIDIVKVRVQLQKTSEYARFRRNRWFDTTRRILKDEGVMAFWRGYTLGQVHSVVGVSSQFYIYELATRFVSQSGADPKYKPMLLFLCGTLAGGCSCTLVMPLEVIRLRQMVIKDQYRGFINGARAVYRTGGVLAFYEGLSASLVQIAPAAGISFSVFRYIQPKILHFLGDNYKSATPTKALPQRTSANKHKPEHLLVASSVAGAFAGFISKTITYPFDLVKKRLQIASHQDDDRFQAPRTLKKLFKCNSLFGCLKATYEKEGLLGLFRGWKITIIKSQVTSVVAFTTYELTCYVIRELEDI